VADVWLAQARLHQGRPLDALEALARPSVDPTSLAHPWAHLHLRFNRMVALGQLGRVGEALRVGAELDAVVAREGVVGQRFVGPAANTSGWLLRWSGRGPEADARNELAVSVTGGASGPSMEAGAEYHYVGLLDLADGCVLRGDGAAAADLLPRLAAVDAWAGTMAWHQRHRLGLLRARLALLDGNADEAAALARAVADDASERGADRYGLLARAVVGIADTSIAVDALGAVVDGLGRCAVLDGWPLVAALGRARDVDSWVTEAGRRAAGVVAAAGDDAAAARALVSSILG
jgi:hypothetical protein